MNLNGDDKRIQRLFRELRSDDERRVPEFARVVEASRSRASRSQDRIRLAAVVAMLIVAALLAVIAVRNSKPGTTSVSPLQAEVKPAPPEPLRNVDQPEPKELGAHIPKRSIKRVRHRRTSNELAVAMRSLVAWQSPTASLLRAPGEEMLKSLPRLGESLQKIKPLLLDQFN